MGYLTDRNKENSSFSRNMEEERARHLRTETELRDENMKLKKRIMELETSIELKDNQYKTEIAKLENEVQNLRKDNDNMHSQLEDYKRELDDEKDISKDLRKDISKLTFENDELNEKVAYYQRKYKNAISEYEEEMMKKKAEENTAREDLTLRKLADIENKLANLHIVISPSKDSQSKAEEEQNVEESGDRVDTEKLLEGDSESFEHKLENYQKHKGKTDNLLRKLTRKILEKEELQNTHIRELFKLGEINLEDKANEYKNLLKAMGALYYANRHAKLVAGVFSFWKNATAQKIQQKMDDENQEEIIENQAENQQENQQENQEENQQENQEENEQENEEENQEKTEEKKEPEKSSEQEIIEENKKPEMKIDTEISDSNNKPSEQHNEELINEMQINTNKEASSSDEKGILHHQKENEEKSENEQIHIDENYDAKQNEKNETEEKQETNKIRLEDIDENDLKDLITQLREHLIEELKEEMEKQKEVKNETVTSKAESKAAEPSTIKLETQPKAEDLPILISQYQKLTSGITDYFFSLFNKSVKYSKPHKTYFFF